MAVIAQTSGTTIGDLAITETVLGASNTLAYLPATQQTLRLRNATGGALSPVITGSASVAQSVPRVGTVNFAAGWAVQTMAPGAVVEIDLDSIADYIRGTIDITGASGMIATLRSPFGVAVTPPPATLDNLVFGADNLVFGADNLVFS